ncbi:MAG TPA: Lrp/AsnC family transcriptional regulator [Bacteroidetes bacterium]|nr:Lrp/AsnC family transcriptional regulator [Bacteroidota bacterium]
MTKLDSTDLKILNLLQQDGRMTIKELSGKLNLSTTPVFERIKKLERSGVIDHYSAILNTEKLGMKLTAFAHISIKDHSKELIEAFVKEVTEFPEVQEFHYVSGASDFMIKVLVQDIEKYNHFILDKLLSVPNIGKVESLFSLRARKKTAIVAL